jgi:uncharacterized membrane protein YcaP (DUF421 family)
VEYAILETNGKLSIQMKAPNQPITCKDMNLQPSYKGLCTNLIIDGKILDDHLQISKKNQKWLIKELKKQNISNTSDVLLHI